MHIVVRFFSSVFHRRNRIKRKRARLSIALPIVYCQILIEPTVSQSPACISTPWICLEACLGTWKDWLLHTL